MGCPGGRERRDRPRGRRRGAGQANPVFRRRLPRLGVPGLTASAVVSPVVFVGRPCDVSFLFRVRSVKLVLDGARSRQRVGENGCKQGRPRLMFDFCWNLMSLLGAQAALAAAAAAPAVSR